MESFEGYAALLDVLGFSDLVARDSRGTELEDYISTVIAAVGEDVDSVLFSDSIVLTVEGTDDAALLKVVQAASRLMGRLLLAEVPIRGAIATGRLFRRTARNGAGVFVAGRAIVEAYRSEQSQDWVGIMVAPSVLRRVSDLGSKCNMRVRKPSPECLEEVQGRMPWPLFVQRHDAIPVRSAAGATVENYEGFAVVPMPTASSALLATGEIGEVCGKLSRLREIAPDPRAQLKYSRTLKWLREIAQDWKSHAELLTRFRLE